MLRKVLHIRELLTSDVDRAKVENAGLGQSDAGGGVSEEWTESSHKGKSALNTCLAQRTQNHVRCMLVM